MHFGLRALVVLSGGAVLTAACTATAIAREPAVDDLAKIADGIWTLQADGEFAPRNKRWKYAPPPPRTGFYAHGGVEWIESDPGLDLQAIDEKCLETTGKPVERDGPGIEYWYILSGQEGLILERKRSISAVADCRPVYRYALRIRRLLLGKEGFQLFERMPDGRYTAESRLYREFWGPKYDDIYVGQSDDPATWLALRKRRLGDSSTGGSVGKLRTHCIGYNSPPDAGGTQCWIGSDGPSQGLVTYDMAAIAGFPYVHQKLTRVENSDAIDGRLFEWDRAISLAEAGAAR